MYETQSLKMKVVHPGEVAAEVLFTCALWRRCQQLVKSAFAEMLTETGDGTEEEKEFFSIQGMRFWDCASDSLPQDQRLKH